MNALSFRARLTFIHLMLITVILVLTALAGHWGLSRAIHQQLDSALVALAETEIGSLPTDPDAPVIVHDPANGPIAEPALDRLDRLVQVIDMRGAVLARSANLGPSSLPVSPSMLAELATGETAFETLLDFGGEPARMVAVPAPGGKRAVLVAGSLDDVKAVMQAAGLLFAAMAVALLTAVGIAGHWLTRGAFRTIDQVVLQVRDIGDTNLGERLPHPGTRDEIGRLVDTLNDMLARLETGFDAQRRFTADASHELRSPLSRLRAEIDITLRYPREREEYLEVLRSCLEEAERLTQLTDELLLLARADAAQERVPTAPVAIASVVDEAVRLLTPVADERQIAFAVEASPYAVVRMAPGQASLVLNNLLGNALKFSPPQSVVTIRAVVDSGEVLLSVSDMGPGIAPEDLTRIFDRFYRGASTRGADVTGVGLGLALAQSIVHAHGGRIVASNLADGGALFSVRLPLAV
ncbi:HAMP domain-containing protein [Pigmentiphaga aceris]|uniref:histidine kinase n=1 Tax=Pigmentiphaga aceris TaxID=1940612 RepID=A0A5C0AQR7_9BURK|nr:ATP-binding protein [Pigmentiphaga aceris]QEI04439.1 HAMP domain-containing protein [Pigmentiphaga aceris]